MRGRPIPLSLPRRLVGDLMHISMGIPRVTVQRRMNLSRLIAARRSLAQRPAWTAIFAKGFGLLADEMREFRQAYIPLPWPHLYEYPDSVAGITHERDYAGERAVLQSVVKSPGKLPVMKLSALIEEARTRPVMEIKAFRHSLRLARFPTPVRRLAMALIMAFGRQRANYLGTFHLSVYSALGAESLNPLSPLTTLLNYGPIDGEGGVNVRILYDHRVMDGATVARALERFEAILNVAVADELIALADPASSRKAAMRREAAG